MQELYGYENLCVLSNYVSLSSSIVDDNINKTRRRLGMIFSSSFDRRKADQTRGAHPLAFLLLLLTGSTNSAEILSLSILLILTRFCGILKNIHCIGLPQQRRIYWISILSLFHYHPYETLEALRSLFSDIICNITFQFTTVEIMPNCLA